MRQRMDKMKKRNKNYLSLAEQGIHKAWDKAVIFKDRRTCQFQMVVYYRNKPFYYWPVKNASDIKNLRISLAVLLSCYGDANLNERKIKKCTARYFISCGSGERVISYRRGGDLFPSIEGV